MSIEILVDPSFEAVHARPPVLTLMHLLAGVGIAVLLVGLVVAGLLREISRRRLALPSRETWRSLDRPLHVRN